MKNHNIYVCVKPFLAEGNNNLIMPGRMYFITRKPFTPGSKAPKRVLISEVHIFPMASKEFVLRETTFDANFVKAEDPELRSIEDMKVNGAMEIAIMSEENHLIANLLVKEYGSHEEKTVLCRHWNWHKMVFVRNLDRQYRFKEDNAGPGILASNPTEWADPVFGEAIRNK